MSIELGIFIIFIFWLFIFLFVLYKDRRNLFLGISFLATILFLALYLMFIVVKYANDYPIIYYIGAYIDLKRPSKSFCMVIGIFLMFLLLTISVLIGTFTLRILFENSIDNFSYLNTLLIFYVFGSVQTLFVGLWLGVKLNQLLK